MPWNRTSMRPHAVAPLAAAAAVLMATNAPAQDADDGGRIQQVTITAEKRLTTLDTTPSAVSALAGARLADQGLTGFADLVTEVPNVSFTTGQGEAQFFIRGIGNVFILAGGDPGVALYADGAYVSDQTSSNVALFDLQRVEVLRGPQGALYGRNATGGAINLIAAAPTATFQGRAGVLFGDHGRKESDGFVSGPLGESGSTRLRLSYQVKQDDGYTDNPLAGSSNGPVLAGGPTTTAPDRLDDLKSRALRLQSATSFGDAQLRVIAGHYRERDAGPSMPVLADPAMIPVLLFGASPSADPRVVKSQGATNKIEVDSLLGIWEQALGSASLTVTAGYRRSHANRFWDSDATESPTATSGFATHSSDTSLDVHLASDDKGPFTWLVGATALEFQQTQDVDIATQVPLGFVVTGAPLTTPLPGGVEFLLGGTVKTRSGALYTDLRYALSPQWALLGGVRVNRDRKQDDEYQNIAAFGMAGTNHLSDGWTSVPLSLGTEYRFDRSLLGYARVATGFKSGAVNLGALQPNMVDPEHVTSVELGLKADFWDRRGAIAAALFDSRYRDMQVSQVGQATVILANASRARISGAELELQLRPLQPLTLGLSLGLMNPEYTDFTNVDLRNNPGVAVNVSGRQLAQVSRSQAALNAEWVQPVGAYKATLRADVVWRSRYYFTEFNTADATQGAYGLVNVSASVRPAAGGWKLYSWIKNLGDKTALTSMSIASPLLGAARQVTYTPPRQFGIGADLEF